MKVVDLMLLSGLILKQTHSFVLKKPSIRPNTSVRMIGSILDLLNGGGGLIDPEKALPGRDTEMPNIGKHYVLGNDLKEVPEGHKVAVYGVRI